MTTTKLQMADIARMAGVSKATVSRALADSPLVNEVTRERIKGIAREHRYRIDRSARNFRLKESLTVSLLMPRARGVTWTLSDPFFLEMTAAVAEVLDGRGHSLLLSRAVPQAGEWVAGYLEKGLADGVILVGQGDHHVLINEAASMGTPLAVWGEPVADAKYPVVGSDNRLGGALAAEHLLQRGCRRLALVGVTSEQTPSPEMSARREGFMAACTSAGIASSDILEFSPVVGADNAELAVAGLVAAAEQIDGVFAVTDMQAIACISALSAAGIGVPDRVRVVGYDDLPVASLYYPSLTTISQDIRLGAKCLVDSLLATRGNEAPPPVRLTPRLVVRRSS